MAYWCYTTFVLKAIYMLHNEVRQYCNTLDSFCYDVATINTGSPSMEGYAHTTHLSASQEGVIDWIRNKIEAIKRRTKLLVNSVLAKFSKNRAELEANIQFCRANPTAKVELAVNSSTFGSILKAVAIAASFVVLYKFVKQSRIKALEHMQARDDLRDLTRKANELTKKIKATDEKQTYSAAQIARASEQLKHAQQQVGAAFQQMAKDMPTVLAEAEKTIRDHNAKVAAVKQAKAIADSASAMAKIGEVTNKIVSDGVKVMKPVRRYKSK